MGFILINKTTGEFVQLNTSNSVYELTKDSSKCHHFKKRKSAVNFRDCDTQKILTTVGWKVISDYMLADLESGKISLSEIEDFEPIQPYKVPDTTENVEDTQDDVKIKASSKVDFSLDDMEKFKHFKHFDVDADLSKSFEVPNIDIIGTIKQFETFLKKMQEYASVLSQQFTYIESCKVDFEHKFEFDAKKIDFVKRTELATNYTTCLEERRRIKDDILILEKLLNASVSDLIDGKMDSFLQTLEHRHYKPRVAPELFTDKEVVQVKPKFTFDTLQRDTLTSQVESLNQSVSFGTETSYLELISGFEPLPDCGE